MLTVLVVRSLRWQGRFACEVIRYYTKTLKLLQQHFFLFSIFLPFFYKYYYMLT